MAVRLTIPHRTQRRDTETDTLFLSRSEQARKRQIPCSTLVSPGSEGFDWARSRSRPIKTLRSTPCPNGIHRHRTWRCRVPEVSHYSERQAALHSFLVLEQLHQRHTRYFSRKTDKFAEKN